MNDCQYVAETREHQQNVANLLMDCAMLLIKRAKTHDASKLMEPEKSGFMMYVDCLKNSTYGSEEYFKCLEEMRPFLHHHYLNNQHHPEFNDLNGFSFQTLNDPIRSMHLIDIIEMICDWIAASRRHDNGNAAVSVSKSIERFKIEDQFAQVMRNTLGLLED